MWSLVLVCTTRSKTCLRRRSSTLSALLRFNPKRSNGSSWSPVVTDAWISSMKLLRCMRRSTRKTRTTSTVCAVLSQSVASSAWSTTPSRRSLPCLTVKRKPSVSTSTPRTSSTIREWVVVSRASWAQHLSPRSVTCPTWMTCQDPKLISVVWEEMHLPSRKKRTFGIRRPFSSDHLPVSIIHCIFML